MERKSIAIVGAGFAGAVLARELALSGKFKITVFDERDHIAGNCHTQRDGETGIMIHTYGPHIFNTSREDVWSFVNRFGTFDPFINRVRAVTSRGIFSLPINLKTINQFFGERFSSEEAQRFVLGLGDKSITHPQNFEEQALKFLGRDLYENFFYGYTKKQWGVEPKELPASILKRLPIRFTEDDNYYDQKYQGIPREGYTTVVENILKGVELKICLKEKFHRSQLKEFDHCFYSGPIDSFFDFEEGRLNYRSLRFEKFTAKGDFQGTAVVNYCQEEIPYTRITEHKFFTPAQKFNQTVYFKEYSMVASKDDTPYYPMRLQQDKDLLERYLKRAHQISNVTFIGRLGTYRYLDMHQVIGESLDLAKSCLENEHSRWPKIKN